MTLKKLFDIDRNIKRVKLLHDLGKVSTKDAKEKIRNFEEDIMKALGKLPNDERRQFVRQRYIKQNPPQI